MSETVPQPTEAQAQAWLDDFTEAAKDRAGAIDHQAQYNAEVEKLRAKCDRLPGVQMLIKGYLDDENGHSTHPEGPNKIGMTSVIIDHARVEEANDLSPKEQHLAPYSPCIIVGATEEGTTETVTARLIGEDQGGVTAYIRVGSEDVVVPF